MTEYFIVTNSFAAPFCSDTAHSYATGSTARDALKSVVEKYSHPCGLYAAEAYTSADTRNKGEKPLARWLCNHELAREKATKGLDSYSYLGHGPGKFEVNRVLHEVKDPKAGRYLGASHE